MPDITSRDNPRVREFTRLRDDRAARGAGRFTLEGARLIAEAAKSGMEILTLYVTPQGVRRAGDRYGPICGAAREVVTISATVSDKLSDTRTPQGIYALCAGNPVRQGLPDALPGGGLILASLQDPGNVGTILRSAEAFGLSGVVLTPDCPDPLSPKVLRASMGAVFRLPVYLGDAAGAVCRLRAAGTPVYAATPASDSLPVRTLPLRGAAIVIGNEGAGLSSALIAQCSGRAVIPMSPAAESLNAAMAATVFCYELSLTARENAT